MTAQQFSDETLMAYADGALDAEAARAVERAAAEDAAVAERVALFRRTGEVLAAARAARPAEPVPAALMSTVRATLDAAARDGATVAPFARPASEKAAAHLPWAPMALAASLALAVGLAAGLMLRPGPAPEAPTGLAALEAGGIAGALSRLEAGASERVAAGEVSLVASFRTSDGAFCREFELAAEGEAVVGIACAEDGSWDLRFAVAKGGAGGQDYAPAGALEALDAWLAGIGAGAPLSAEAERAALSDLGE